MAGPISSAPVLKLLDALLFSDLPSFWKIAVTLMLPIGLVSYVSSPSELNIITSVTELDSRAMTLTILLSLDVMAFSRSRRKGRNVDALVCLQSCFTG